MQPQILVKIWKQSFTWIIPRYFSSTNGNFHPFKTSPKTINLNRIVSPRCDKHRHFLSYVGIIWTIYSITHKLPNVGFNGVIFHAC